MFSALSPTCRLFPTQAWLWGLRLPSRDSLEHAFPPREPSLLSRGSFPLRGTFELAHCTQAVCIPQRQCALVVEPRFCDWRLPCIFGHSGHWRVNWGFSSVQLFSPFFGVVFYWLVTSRGLGIKRRAEAQFHVSLTERSLF